MIDDYYIDYRTAPPRLPIGKNPVSRFSQAHILKRGDSRITTATPRLHKGRHAHEFSTI